MNDEFPSLSPEDKRRIEEEERYRAMLRAQAMRPTPAEPPKQETPWAERIVIGGIVVGLLVLFTVTMPKLMRPPGDKSAGAESSIFSSYEPVQQSVLDGELSIAPRQTTSQSFTVPDGAINGEISGTFTASGGFGNDVEAAILSDQIGLSNYMNGHYTQGVWFTPGQQTSGRFDVRLRPGTYYIAFRNYNALFSTKRVYVQALLKYSALKGSQSQ